MAKMLTTIKDLSVNDVFTTDIDSADEWRILSTNCFFRRQHLYGALAMLLASGKIKTKPFRRNKQVVYLRKMIAV